MEKTFSIILMGIKHCGKTTQGKLLGEKLSLPFFDTDDVILRNEGKSAREIFSMQGEDEFKRSEARACRWIRSELEKSGNRAVIATGGGICSNSEALDILRPIGKFVFLKSDESVAAARILREASIDGSGRIQNIPAYIAKKNPRSLEDVRKIFHDFYTQRSEIYSRIAEASVFLPQATKQENTARILRTLGL